MYIYNLYKYYIVMRCYDHFVIDFLVILYDPNRGSPHGNLETVSPEPLPYCCWVTKLREYLPQNNQQIDHAKNGGMTIISIRYH